MTGVTAEMRLVAVASCAVLLLAAGVGTVAAMEQGTITAVRVSPDLSKVIVQFSGQVGRHSAFVMASPHRLVLDFDGTGVARIPGKLAVNRAPIREVRVGQADSRARLVVDFGDEPVPPFQVNRSENTVTVALGNAPHGKDAVAARTPLRREGASTSTRTVVAKPSPVARPSERPAAPNTTGDETLAVKTAGVKGGLVFVELFDRRNPARTYRLVVDVDPKEMGVKHATLSDAKGSVKRFHLAESGNDAVETAAESDRVSAGPRKNVGPVAGEEKKPRFKWGLQTAGTGDDPEEAVPVGHRGPKMEQFLLEERKK